MGLKIFCMIMPVVLAVLSGSPVTAGSDELSIWDQFTTALKTGSITVDDIRPYTELGDAYKPTLLRYLNMLRAEAEAQNWSVQPEIITVGNRIQYLFPWTTNGQSVSYCFSIVPEGSRWYFQHLEAIFIRLDKLPPLPTSQFPDVAEEQKAWAREEIYWSFIVLNMYLPIAEKLGPASALDLLKDGPGYFVGAKSWVPFASPAKSFILYLCWEQAHLRGNQVTLETLSDTAAVVHLNPIFLSLYFRTAHLKPQISLEDYRRIFETIWQDRASAAGWKLRIEYAPDNSVTFRFSRPGGRQ